MIDSTHLRTARMMIDAHGLQAHALAQLRLREHRQQHNTTGTERWQDIQAAIAELRRIGVAAVSLRAG